MVLGPQGIGPGGCEAAWPCLPGPPVRGACSQQLKGEILQNYEMPFVSKRQPSTLAFVNNPVETAGISNGDVLSPSFLPSLVGFLPPSTTLRHQCRPTDSVASVVTSQYCHLF